jgi:hypothetical protein
MTEADDQLLSQRVRAIRVLGIALVAGTLVSAAMMIGMVVFAFDGKPLIGNGPNGFPIVTLVGLAVAVPSLLLSLILPTKVRDTQLARLRNQGKVSVPSLIAAYTSTLILGLALAEAPAIMGSIFYLMEGHWLSLLPVGFGILLMIWKQPGESAIREWVTDQTDELTAGGAQSGSEGGAA